MDEAGAVIPDNSDNPDYLDEKPSAVAYYIVFPLVGALIVLFGVAYTYYLLRKWWTPRLLQNLNAANNQRPAVIETATNLAGNASQNVSAISHINLQRQPYPFAL